MPIFISAFKTAEGWTSNPVMSKRMTQHYVLKQCPELREQVLAAKIGDRITLGDTIGCTLYLKRVA